MTRTTDAIGSTREGQPRSSAPAAPDQAARRSGTPSTRPPRRQRSRLARPSLWLSMAIVIPVVAVVVMAVVPATRWLTAYGYVTTDDEVELRPSVEGMISSWQVNSGDQVEAGQLLIQLHDAVPAAALEEARSNVEARQAELERMVSAQSLRDRERAEQIIQAEQTLALVTGHLERMREGGQGFSRKEIEEADLRVRLAQSRLSELRLDRTEIDDRQLVVVRREIESMRKRVAMLEAEVMMRQILAPIAGTVHFHRFEPGEVVKPEHVLGQIFDTGKWIIKLSLPESQMRFVTEGQPVAVAFRAYPYWLHGKAEAKVTRIVPMVTPRDQGDGIFYLEAELVDLNGLTPQPGMRVSAWIDAGRTTFLRYLLGV